MSQLIVIAQGVEIRDAGQGTILQKFLADNCDLQGKPHPDPNTWLFPKGAGAAKAGHEIRVVYDKADFAKALDTADAWVVYEGHSRYGQGPAFGPTGVPHVPDVAAFPVNPWGVHFRMGYDATDTECLGDLLEHSVSPLEYDLPAADPKAFLPEELRNAAKQAQAQAKAITTKKIKAAAVCGLTGAWRSMDACQPKVAGTATARKETPLKGRHFYRQKTKPDEFLTAVRVGSADLDASSLKCRVLFMASCSSQVHFLDALDRRRKAAKSACALLLTGQVCATSHATTFLKQVLLKKRDPTKAKSLRRIVRALNGEAKSGLVGIF